MSSLPALASSSADMANPSPEVAEPQVAEAQTGEVCRVTLITGDIVTVVTSPDGQRNFAISPAEPDRLGQHFLTVEQRGSTYVFPDDVDLEKLDRELFNIDYLVDEKYYREPSLPLLVTYSPTLADPGVQSLQGKISRLGEETELHKQVHTISTRLAYKDVSASYNKLENQPEVEKIWLDKKVHAKLVQSVPLIGAQWWWGAIGNRGEGEEIAILDTGIDSSHPALDDLDDNPATEDPKVIVNVNFSDDQTFDDLFGHGTHCAGIAAGTAAGSDYQGVAPRAQLWNVKVLNQWGYGYESWIIRGINFASLGPDNVPETGDEADIISMSLGRLDYSDGTDPVSQAVNLAVERGVVVAVAAGNDGYWGPLTIGTPGVAEKVITVGASDKLDNLADLSSRGPTMDLRVKPDILAPGVAITSSVPTDPDCYLSDPSGYMSLSGTSMATPHVAGAAALLLHYYGESATPQFIKDILMCTARDLAYTVYEQGGGRLDLAWEPWPTVGVTPASLSLGLFTSDEEATQGTFTFLTEDTSPHDVTLTASLMDIINDTDYSGSITLDLASFAVPAGGKIDVGLNIDLSTLPASLYSGKVIATVDGGSSRRIHAIFGFAKLREITIHKTDINGEPAQGHPVWLFCESPLQADFSYGQVDETGKFTFYAVDGNYHLISPNWWHEENQITIWTVKENVAISADMEIGLDERDTKVVDLDPNKVEQVAASKSSYLHLYLDRSGFSWSSRWWYPQSFLTRISPVSMFDVSFKYEYYPEQDLHPACPELVNTDEWHHLRYSLTEVTDDIAFVADYDNLIRRDTSYCTALNDGGADWLQWSFDDISRGDWCFIYSMDAPQERQEWLSPQPVEYSQEYLQHELGTWGEWRYWGWTPSYPSGEEYEWGIGCHPLTSGVDIGIWGDELHIWGPISRDSANNEFSNQQAEFSGHITVTQDNEVVLEDDIWDHFYRWVEFEGTPQFTVEVWGETPLELSRNSYTRLDFTADPAHDCRPPKIWFSPVEPEANLYGVVPSGSVKVGVRVEDDSVVESVGLHYSLDDGETWLDTGSPVFEQGYYIFDLGELAENTFVTLAVDAEDEYGNFIHRNTNRAFCVGMAGPPPTTVQLWEGANPILYTSATTDLPDALTNIADITEVVWQRDASTGGEWWFYLVPLDHGQITQLENGKVYIVVVSQGCTWELLQ